MPASELCDTFPVNVPQNNQKPKVRVLSTERGTTVTMREGSLERPTKENVEVWHGTCQLGSVARCLRPLQIQSGVRTFQNDLSRIRWHKDGFNRISSGHEVDLSAFEGVERSTKLDAEAGLKMLNPSIIPRMVYCNSKQEEQ